MYEVICRGTVRETYYVDAEHPDDINVNDLMADLDPAISEVIDIEITDVAPTRDLGLDPRA